MDANEKVLLQQHISQLESQNSWLGPREAETMMMSILKPLLQEAGYTVEHTRPRGRGFDFVARQPESGAAGANSMGISYKHMSRPLGLEYVHSQMGAQAAQHDFKRVMLITKSYFTSSARELVRQQDPLRLELIDIDALKAWAARIEVEDIHYRR